MALIRTEPHMEVHAYSLPELARLYKISEKTFKKWIKPFKADIGQRQGRYYNIAQVKIIFSKLGEPGE